MSIFQRLSDVLRRQRLTDEFDEELRFHHDHIVRERMAEGRSPADAEYDARRRIGNTTMLAEEVRTVGSFTWFEHLQQDVRYGLRALRRSPGFTSIAALTLALGIGANTAIFTVLNGVVFKPLPFREPDRVVTIWETMTDASKIFVSYPNYLDWKTRVKSFEDVALYNGYKTFTLTGMGRAERLRGGLATGNLFSTLGVKPSLGRLLTPNDDRMGAERVAVITDAFWQERFAGEESVLGKTLMLDGFSYAIVGVLPPRVRVSGSEFWLPAGLFATSEEMSSRDTHPGLVGVARLRPGVTIAQMRAELEAVYRQLEAEYPKQNTGIRASGTLYLDQVLGDIRDALYIIAGAVGVVLLIACANVANLLLGRASARQRELSLRLSLGARPARIVRQLLTESVLLSVIGGALGAALAWAGVRVLLSLRPGNVPRLTEIQVDPTVLAFALGLSVLTGIAFGVLPAWQATRSNLVGSMRDGGRGATTGVQGLRTRSALTVVEVALAIVLLVSAGLLVRSFRNLTQVDLGANPRNVVTGTVSLPESKYPGETRQAAFEALLGRVRAIPGVTSASLSSDLPTSTNWQQGLSFEKLPPAAAGSEPLFNVVVTDPDWFSTMRMRVMSGRGIERGDVASAPGVVVISQGIADRLGGAASAIGQRLKMGRASDQAPWLTIVGVVNDIRDSGPGVAPRGTIYLSFAQNPSNGMWLAVRTQGSASEAVPSLREALAAIDPEIPLANVRTLEDRVAESVAQPRFSMLMLGIFAAIALLLAAIGIYGVISYNVAQRTHEIGIRMALGASPVDVVRMVARQALTMAGAGIVIGGVLALVSGKLLSTLLFDVAPSDPITFGAVAIALAGVALIAAAVPAWRAARLDPVSALRSD